MSTVTTIRAPVHLWLLGLGALLILAVLPQFTSGYTVRIVINACRNLVLALSFDIIGGYTGYINLGHAAFFGMSAYAFGICVNAGVPVLVAGAVAVGCTALLAGLMSYPFFRLRGPYYALATFGLLKLCEELALTLSGLTGGSGGLSVLWPENLRLTYYLNLGLVVCTFGTVWLIARSRFGLGLVSIREDEQVARAFGVAIFWYKCRALVISAALAAALGPIYLSDRLYINPGEMFGLETALMPITMAMLGGSGLLIGPVVGVTFLSLVQELLWTQVGFLRLASLGLVLAMVGLFMPGGSYDYPLSLPVYTVGALWGGFKVFFMKSPTAIWCGRGVPALRSGYFRTLLRRTPKPTAMVPAKSKNVPGSGVGTAAKRSLPALVSRVAIKVLPRSNCAFLKVPGSRGSLNTMLGLKRVPRESRSFTSTIPSAKDPFPPLPGLDRDVPLIETP